VLVYACEQAQRAANAEAPGAVVTVPCVGALPPSFFDFVLSKRRTDGLLLAGCRECDCHYRLGGRWTLERIARTRDPMLRARVPSERIEVEWAGHSRRDLRAALARLHERLAATTSGAAGS
jgi:coenzyme F420-reducing hydrogenase delta subunit